jgi:hypothetical protein
VAHDYYAEGVELEPKVKGAIGVAAASYGQLKAEVGVSSFGFIDAAHNVWRRGEVGQLILMLANGETQVVDSSLQTGR